MKLRNLLVVSLAITCLLGYTIPAQAATTNPPNTPPHPAVPSTLATPDPLKPTKPGPVGPLEVSSAVYSDESQPVRDLVGLAPATFDNGGDSNEQLLPIMGKPGEHDGALQTSAGPLVGTTSGLNFAGIGLGDYGSVIYAPSDDNGAVGATQYVQWVNASFAVFNKTTGAIVSGFPKLGNSIWVGFGGGCENNNDGDPIVQYDKIHDRWVLTQFSVSSTPYLECVAVSTTSDATGSYYRYAFSYGNTQFNDYPKLGIWPDGYYISYNIFTSSFNGAKVCAFDSAKMLVGDVSATQQCFQLSSSYGGLLPSDLDGKTLPPSGSPNYFMNFSSTALKLWKFHVDWVNTANTTFIGPSNIPVPSFSAACGGGGTCIPQSGVTQQLDSLADRLMFRLAYRNFGDHEALVVNHSVTAGSSVGLRWYEIRSPNSSPSIYQSGTFAPDSNYRWMGSIAMDKVGDIALGYSVSSSTMNPSIRYTGRVPSDPLGTMEAETTIMTGGGSQTGSNLSRWGDYTAMTVDPVDDCTFWYTNQYLKANGSWNWSTRIASFKFPGCNDTTPPTVTSIARASTNPSAAASVDFTVTFSESVTGVNAADFSITQSGLTGTAITNVSGSGSVYTVTVSPGTGSGTLRLDLIDNDSIQDLAGNPLGGTGINNGNFSTGEVYTIYVPNADVTIGGVDQGAFSFPRDTFLTENAASLVNGPVQVTTSDGSPFISSQRTTSGESYNEVMGVPTGQLTTDYWFPVYDHSYKYGVNNDTMRMWVLVGNASTTQSANVNIYIAGVLQSGSPFTIAPGGRITPRWIGTKGGPVEVVSTNGAKIFTSERVFTNPTNSFNEILGFPASQITSEYWFPYYDSTSMSNSIQVSNTSSSLAAAVDIYVGTVKEGSYSIPVNSYITKSYPNLVNGPVRVVSTNGAPVVASQITLSGPSNSFNEVIGYPFNKFTTEYWFPSYDHSYQSGVNTNLMRMWVLIGNPSASLAATVDVYIAGVKTADSPFSIPAGGRITPRWIGVTNGPVRVVSTNGVNIFTSERVLTYPNNVFNEMMGFPLNQMASTYWFPYYDSINMSNDILVSRP